MFVKVEYVKFDLHLFGGIGYSEEEPLGVAAGIDVVLEEKVVLAEREFAGHREVPRLKPRLKDKRGISLCKLIKL